jgi:hypothetical protein
MSDPGSGGIFTSLLLAFADFAQPVVDSFDSPEAMEYFWYQFGWRVTLDDVAAAAISAELPIGADLKQLETSARAIRDTIESGTAPSVDELTQLAGIVSGLADALGKYSPATPASLPAPLNDPASWQDLAEQLFDALLERYLRLQHPTIYLALLTTGCIDYQPQPATPPWRVAYKRPVFDWQQLQAMLHDPIGGLVQVYHWNDPPTPFDHPRLLDSLDRVLTAVGLSTDTLVPAFQLEPGLPPETAAKISPNVDALRVTLVQGFALTDQSSYAVGFDLLPASDTGAGAPTGLILRPRLIASVADPIPLGKSFAVTFSAAAAVGDVLGMTFFPGDFALTGGDATLGTSVALAATSAQPFYALGTSSSARIELEHPSLTISFEDVGSAVALQIKLTTSSSPTSAGCKIVVPLDQADGFVQACATDQAIEVSFTPELIWSTAKGFSFNGSITPHFNAPVSLQIGSFTVTNIRIGVADGPSQTSNPSFALQAAVDITGSIGPIGLALAGIGLALDVTPYSQQDLLALPPGASRPALGNLDVGLQFLPPTGVGISLNTAVVTGGGFIEHSGDIYAGALDLSVCGYAVKAFGLIQTPGPGEPGYSFVAVISVQFVPEIDLPYDFTLDGVGGFIGINRTISEDAITAALWAHHLDGLLFPADPVAAAPQLIPALGSYFPEAEGRYVFGPLGKIGWAADIVTGEAALLLELPEPIRLMLIGDIQVGVPSNSPQLVLHISFDGGIDFGKQLAFFDATLHDSRLESYPISGDLAFRYSWGTQAVFALALGGFNPQFQPPAGFPTLKRLAISIHSSVAKIEAQSYLALTSNTLQFGARVELTAGTGTFNVHGWLGFDALCERNPLAFEFDLTAGVDLRAGTDVIASVHLDGKLSGPTPWHIAGNASLSLLFFDVTVHFDKTWGSNATALPAPDPLAALAAALADRSSWAGALPAGVRAAITPTGSPPDAGPAVLLDPAATLRISQRTLPLDQPITRFAGSPLGQTLTLTLASLTVFGNTTVASGITSEEFAPSQFLDLTDAEKLSLPSFSTFDAGVEVAADAIDLGNSSRTRAVITPISFITTTLDSRPGPPNRTYLPTVTAVLALNSSAGSPPPGLGRYTPPAGTPGKVTLTADQWTIASTSDLTIRTDIDCDGSKLSAHLALSAYLASHPDETDGLQVVLTQEAA